MIFYEILLLWYDQNKRDLPWRLTDNPYVIWIAEVVFQQTRINQGLPYFIAFIEQFPTIRDLAEAKEEEVLKMWQGLGYYSRARNLQFSARYIVNELDGQMPTTYKELLKLKGVGPYIAAEVASVCYKEKVAAVDGNVQRVLARFFGVHEAVNSTAGAKIIQSLADENIATHRPGDFNQALMDFGSMICMPKKPKCVECVFSEKCWANRNGEQIKLPIKEKKIKVKDRFFNYVLEVQDNGIYLEKREGGDVWQGLYQPPLLESPKELENLPNISRKNTQFLYASKRVLSHQRLWLKFWVVDSGSLSITSTKGELVSYKELHNYPVPKSIEQLFLSIEFNSLFKRDE